jgi:hypothetical protein
VLNTASLPTHAFEALDQASQAIEAKDTEKRQVLKDQIESQDVPLRVYLRESLENQLAYIGTLQDPTSQKKLSGAISRSGVNGSSVANVKSVGDVDSLLSNLSNIRIVKKGEGEKSVDIYEGTLPEGMKAFAAYVPFRELAEVYGEPGLSVVSCKQGRYDNEVYACSLIKATTHTVSIHVERDGTNVDRLVLWFAGRDKEVMPITCLGDVPVRCGVDLRPLAEQRVIAQSKRENNWRGKSKPQQRS